MLREARERSLTVRSLLVAVLFAAGAFAPLALALDAPAALGDAPASTALCPRPEHMDGAGLVCPRGDGVFELVLPDGSSGGFTHGPDPVPSAAEALPHAGYGGPTRAPACVDPLDEPFVNIVIYARAVDDEDRFAEYAPKVRHLVERANFILSESAREASGSTADYRVLCDADGRVKVHEAVLPTPREHASFTTIEADLFAQGFADPRTKLWVWYDDRSACSCGGMGSLTGDSARSVRNSDNGNWVTPHVGVTFGYLSVRIMMHENGHNQGAVLKGAPHGTGSGHCFDGSDIMCYNDGGPRGSLYRSSYCSGMPFDCGNDDYYHPDPADGAFTARYWNLGSPVNRFMNGCQHESVLAASVGEVNVGPVSRAVTIPVADACRGNPMAAWVADAATQNEVLHALDVCWRDADGVDLGCVSASQSVNPFPITKHPVVVAEIMDRVPADAAEAVVRFDATGPVKVWFRVA